MISIVLPNYNGAKYLRRAISSFLAQRYEDKELVIVDGKSTDESHRIIEQYAEQNPSIRWLKVADSGISDAINIGNAAARGEILGFLGSDDVLLSGALELVNEYSELVDFDAVIFNKYLYFVEEREFIKRPPPSSVINVETLLQYGTVADLQTTFYRRRVVERNKLNVENKMCMDYELLLELASKNAFFAHVDAEVILEYMDGNISHNNKEQLVEQSEVTERYIGQYSGPLWNDRLTGRTPLTQAAYDDLQERCDGLQKRLDEANARISDLTSDLEKTKSHLSLASSRLNAIRSSGLWWLVRRLIRE